MIFGHWEVENRLHLQKDRECKENKHVVKGNGWGQTWTMLTKYRRVVAPIDGAERTNPPQNPQTMPGYIHKKSQKCSGTRARKV